MDARMPGSLLQERFSELFGATFSRKKNEKFETSIRKAVNEGKWKRVVGLWKESVRLAQERFGAKRQENQDVVRYVPLPFCSCLKLTGLPAVLMQIGRAERTFPGNGGSFMKAPSRRRNSVG